MTTESHGERAQHRRGLQTAADESVLPESRLAQGRFGRLFRRVPAFRPTNDLLVPLAHLMREPADDGAQPSGWSNVEAPSALDHPGGLPAGYTYLGQFIDHDLTFDPTSRLDRDNDPQALRNFRTPRFDLDSVYGQGPDDQPYMYDGLRLRVEEHDAIEDLPRYHGVALIGDPRNDENAIIAQLQLLFLKAHRRALDEVGARTGLVGPELFFEARRVLRWHYQYVALEDFLRRVAGDSIVDTLLNRDGDGFPQFNLRFYNPENSAFIPVEFSVAAYRFGHTLIRPTYRMNDQHPAAVSIFAAEGDDLRGFGPLKPERRIDWKHFFDNVEGQEFQLARRMDARLSPGLFALPFANEPLTQLNLERGRALGLPSGQSLAAIMCDERLTADELELDQLQASDAVKQELLDNTPLWFHVLQEADKRQDGRQLGAVGGRLVAEVFVGIMKLDPLSYLSVDPCWTPQAEKSLAQPMVGAEERFTMGHFVRWATAA